MAALAVREQPNGRGLVRARKAKVGEERAPALGRGRQTAVLRDTRRREAFHHEGEGRGVQVEHVSAVLVVLTCGARRACVCARVRSACAQYPLWVGARSHRRGNRRKG